MPPLLSVRDLKTQFHTEDGVVTAVDGISFDLEHGATLGIVGESGCGKSAASLSIMGLIPQPPGRVAGGQILFEGEDLLQKSPAQMRKIRGNSISMIFQEPMTSLNPVLTIGYQIGEAIRLHQGADKKAARQKAIEILGRVGIPSPEQRVDEYPHQLSGGMRQRVMIAMALACSPKLLIADEPTTALDVTIQAQILDLMRGLQAETGAAIILISHDLGVVAELCKEALVMYAGRIVERADAASLFSRPQHPYTQGLVASIPKAGQAGRRLKTIPGGVPNPLQMPSGCRFHPRCPHARPLCAELAPPLFPLDEGRASACWMHVEFDPGAAAERKSG